MAVKTITIDIQAYEILSRHKKEGQSVSEVIKEHFGPQPTVGRFRERMRSIRFTDEFLDTVERIVKDRKKSPARAVRL